MQNAMRRTLGVSGAAAAAMAATLALAGAASACSWTHKATESCDSGAPTLNISLTDYNSNATNTITAQAENGDYLKITIQGKHGQSTTVPLDAYQFKSDFNATIAAPETAAGADVYTFTVSVSASDSKSGSFTEKVTNTPPTACSPDTAPPTTTPPPTTTTTPPTDTPTSSAAPTTTAAAVAPVSSKTPPTAKPGLAYTGVSTELPLILGAVLIVLGAGALFAMRILKRRRAQS